MLFTAPTAASRSGSEYAASRPASHRSDCRGVLGANLPDCADGGNLTMSEQEGRLQSRCERLVFLRDSRGCERRRTEPSHVWSSDASRTARPLVSPWCRALRRLHRHVGHSDRVTLEPAHVPPPGLITACQNLPPRTFDVPGTSCTGAGSSARRVAAASRSASAAYPPRPAVPNRYDATAAGSLPNRRPYAPGRLPPPRRRWRFVA